MNICQMVLLDGVEPSFPPYQRGVLPLHTMGAYSSSSGGLANGLVDGFFFDQEEKLSPSTLPDLPIGICCITPPFFKNSCIASSVAVVLSNLLILSFIGPA